MYLRVYTNSFVWNT